MIRGTRSGRVLSEDCSVPPMIGVSNKSKQRSEVLTRNFIAEPSDWKTSLSLGKPAKYSAKVQGSSTLPSEADAR